MSEFKLTEKSIEKSIESLSISNERPPLKILARTKTNIEIFEVINDLSINSTDRYIDSYINTSIEYTPKYSNNGRYLALVTGLPHSKLTLVDLSTQSIVFVLSISEIGSIQQFSPLDNYLITWSQFRANKQNDGSNEGNLKIFAISSGGLVASYSHKVFKSDLIQFSNDEKLLLHIVTNEVQIYRLVRSSDRLILEPVGRLIDRSITQFKINSSLNGLPSNYLSIAVFTPEVSGKPAHTSIYRFQRLDSQVDSALNSEIVSQIDSKVDSEIVKVISRSMFSASEAKLLWNSTGSTLLVLTSSDVDRSNTSYYGSSQLFFLSSDGKAEGMIVMKKEGSIHDVQWAPSGDKYVVIAGAMPAQCTLFDLSHNPIYEFGYLHRNTISWSPHSRFLVLAGFGNLAGEIDFYDVLRLRKLGSNVAHCSISYSWSPDSTYFLVGTTAPRMNVDNGFKIFKHNSQGPLVVKPMSILFDVCWQTTSPSTYPPRSVSPLAKDKAISTSTSTISAPYRPPGSTGELSNRLKLETGFTGKVKPVVGAVSSVSKTVRSIPGLPTNPTSQPNKNNNEGTKQKPFQQNNKPSNQQQPTQITNEPVKQLSTQTTANLTNQSTNQQTKHSFNTINEPTINQTKELTIEEKEKKIKSIRKKLKQINELKDKLKSSTSQPDADQLNKLNSEQGLLDELNRFLDT